MANSTISNLTTAATVVGTEVLPIVQSSATVKVSVANLTPGLDTITAVKGGTGQTSYAVGDLLYASTTTALSKLADVATGNALISGGVSTAPSWGKIGLTTHVSGTLPTANGGTNLTSFTSGGVVYASSTSALATGNLLTFNGSTLAVTGALTVTGASTLTGGFTVGATAAPAFSAYQSTIQTPASFAFTKTTLQSELFDTNSNFDSTTNYRFTPTVAGYYQINGVVQFAAGVANLIASIYKNGAEYLRGGIQAPSSFQAAVSGIVYLNGSSDYVELYSFNTTGLIDTVATSSATQFSGAMIRSA